MSLDFSPNYQTVEAAEDLYCSIKLAADRLEKELLESTSGSTISKTPLKPQPNLPSIELVDFNGDPKSKVASMKILSSTMLAKYIIW